MLIKDKEDKKDTKNAKNKKELTSTVNEPSFNCQESDFNQKPQICLLDFKHNVSTALKVKGFNVTDASLGDQILLPNSNRRETSFCLLNHNFPENIHEYDIFCIDMKDKEPIPYEQGKNIRNQSKGNKAYYFFSEYPETIFDPRPFSSWLLKNELQHISNRDYILIIFASSREEQSYTLAVIGNDGYKTAPGGDYNNYSFINDIHYIKNLFGKEVDIINNKGTLANILEKNKESFSYEVVFEHPNYWSSKEARWIYSDKFIPLMLNKNKEVISYIEKINNFILLVLPQTNNKDKLLVQLFDEFFPEVIPELFPRSTLFKWKDDKEYWIPNYKNLVNKKIVLEEEYKKNLSDIDLEISQNYNEYSFLQDLLIETDTKLVISVKRYLEWLGFESVKIMDTDEKLKEEDLQVELPDGLLIIEVKGIGGTSKDSDCSQISKIRHRRCKERGKLDVFALYTVNHQRYLPPKSRKNPPFTETQITDAENDERGLLTTWDLFRAYYQICDGALTKDSVRKSLLNYGLVQFAPDNITLLGKVTEIFKDGYVFILNITNTNIKVGDILTVLQDNNFQKVNVLSLQINGTNVTEVNSGEIGFSIDKPIKKNALIYI